MAFTLRDLNDVYSRTCANFVHIPNRARLKGMTRDLTEEERRVLAYYEAALVHAYSKVGPGSPEELAELFPEYETSDLEKTLDEGF